MPIGEVFLGALITVLFERLASKEVLNFARREGIRSQLKKWRDMLEKIQAVLADAEHKQIREDSAVNLWLKDLRDLAYDVDDLLDEFAYDINRSAARGESSKVHRLGRCFGSCNPCVVVSNARLESRIKFFTDRFESIVKHQDLLRLSDTPITSSGNVGNSDERSTSCVVDESAIFGREKDKEAIIQLLLQGRDQARVGVLPIVGMGGLGKTTLAKLVYNDCIVENNFPVRAWTCVSDQFDIPRITISVLESLKLTPRGTDLNSLQVQLKEALFGKKFLIILDDVWNEDYGAWDSLCAPFSSGLFGSMVIVTARNQGVASLVGNFAPYCLKHLSDDICLSIFLRHALGVTSFEAHQNLADIGVEIAKRCEGLPLAAKMLGGVLRNRHRPEAWRAVLQSDIWDLPESGILPVLKLSYHHLPSHLKQCFAYCSLFPADYGFKKQDMILLWMAEGFLQPRSNQKKQMEELGGDYFDDLTSRSFFQPSNTSSSIFFMHDLIQSLARHVASDAYLHMDDRNEPSQDTTVRVRHSSFIGWKTVIFKRLGVLGDMDSVRTFLALPIEKHPEMLSLISSKVLLDLLLKLTRLRVLCLCGYSIKELPDPVGQLKHLRYLNLTGAEIEKLPESVTSLFNLLTLILRDCGNLIELPSSIGNLVKLRYLDLDDTPKLLRMPSGIKNLTSLQYLSKFVVGKNEELQISDLNNFSSLQGKLSIAGLHNVVDGSSAVHANLKSKDGLEELDMQWRDMFDDSIMDEEIERQVLHHLQPPKTVQKLDIVCYGGKILPFWIGDPSCAPNMARLKIVGCKNVSSLPPLGRLPLLKELTLCGMDGVTSVGDELYGYDDPLFVGKAFPSLEALFIFDMQEWEEWHCSDGREGLHNLRALVVHGCPKLTGKLPSHLPSIKMLHIRDCPQLSTTPLATWSLTSLSDLYLDECVIDEGSLQVHLSSLTKLKIGYISDLCSLSMLSSLPCLRELSIERCPRLLSWGEMTLPSTLKRLELIECEALETLPLMHAECILDTLYIKGCSSLESFPVLEEGKSSESACWRVKSLSIIDNNDKLSEDITVRDIESLNIEKCPSLMCFPAKGKKLPSSLKSLSISECENLHTLTEGMLMQDNNTPLSLKVISISNCPSLTSFPTLCKLPTSLKQLTIAECSEAECSESAVIPETLSGSSLEEIHIIKCPNIQEFPESIVQHNIPNLKKVTVSHCKNLQSLPNQINSLTNLDELNIDGCPAVRWSNIPQGRGLGLPLNITKLFIGKTLLHEKDICKWGLDCLTSLKILQINGEGMDDVISLPEHDDGKCFFLPTSITFLVMVGFKNLESLRDGLEKLSSLQGLTIHDCPKLRYLPLRGLSSSLVLLNVSGSPMVGEHCKKDGGDYWPIISHLLYVYVDGQLQ